MSLPFNRVYKLCLWDRESVIKYKGKFSVDNATDVIDSLDIQFHVSRTSTFVNNASISICGLKPDTIKKYMSLFGMMSKAGFARIALYAGYQNGDDKSDRIGEIVSGDILTFVPTSPPDVWCKIECWTGYTGMLEVKNTKTWTGKNIDKATGAIATDPATKMPKGLSLYDVAGICSKTIFGSYTEGDANDHGLVFKGTELESVVKKINVGTFTCWGNESRILRTLNSFDNNIKFMRKGENLHVFNLRDIHSYNTDWPRIDPSMVISPDTGMIGLPRIYNCGMNVDVDVMLDPRFEVFDLINVYSYYLSKFSRKHDETSNVTDGKYRILSITHRGHLRGGEWMTTLHLMNNDYYNPNIIGPLGTNYFDDSNKAANYGYA